MVAALQSTIYLNNPTDWRKKLRGRSADKVVLRNLNDLEEQDEIDKCVAAARNVVRMKRGPVVVNVIPKESLHADDHRLKFNRMLCFKCGGVLLSTFNGVHPLSSNPCHC